MISKIGLESLIGADEKTQKMWLLEKGYHLPNNSKKDYYSKLIMGQSKGVKQKALKSIPFLTNADIGIDSEDIYCSILTEYDCYQSLNNTVGFSLKSLPEKEWLITWAYLNVKHALVVKYFEKYASKGKFQEKDFDTVLTLDLITAKPKEYHVDLSNYVELPLIKAMKDNFKRYQKILKILSKAENLRIELTTMNKEKFEVYLCYVTWDRNLLVEIPQKMLK